MESIEFQSTGLFRSKVIKPKQDPVGISSNILIGVDKAKKKKRERHISDLCISEVGTPKEENKI